MNERKNNTVLLTVIAIATLLVAVVGATFAFFSARVVGDDNASTIQIQAASVGDRQIEMSSSVPETLKDNIYPRDEYWARQSFYISLSATEATGNGMMQYSLIPSFSHDEDGDGTDFADDDIGVTFEMVTLAADDFGEHGIASNVGKYTEITTIKTLKTTDTNVVLGQVSIPKNKAVNVNYTLKVFFVNKPTVEQNTTNDGRSFTWYVQSQYLESDSTYTKQTYQVEVSDK